MAAHATYYGLHVRRIKRGDDLIVQRRNYMTLEWVDVETYSEWYDYAYSDSSRMATALAARLGRHGDGEPMPASKTMATQ